MLGDPGVKSTDIVLPSILRQFSFEQLTLSWIFPSPPKDWEQ